MIQKPIHTIDLDDLRALVDDEVREGKTIEYKCELPGGADSDRVSLLATVSSFANTAGGDLLIGVEAEEGVPTAYLLFETEQHGFRQPENIKRALDAELYFYATVLLRKGLRF